MNFREKCGDGKNAGTDGTDPNCNRGLKPGERRDIPPKNTSDPLVPNQVLYQAEPLPDKRAIRRDHEVGKTRRSHTRTNTSSRL
ncbi:hypothetical protein SBA7_1750011 [Candidatus Sulfotelmatobacter sp. SbA7]|nr:hypothetical protein SBA7_1750011 [Candidatus Sulfotelmatobacter sp. SbA7]